MKADAHPLSRIFGLPQQLMAPLFQRPYVWSRDNQWEPLWEDIRGVAEALHAGHEDIKPHFLGAIVLDQQLTPVHHVPTRFIIDGQQRLATLQVFFAAFRDACRQVLEDDRLAEAVEEMIFNTSKLIEDETQRFKVLPTNVDRVAYRIAMTAGNPKTAHNMHKEATSLDGRLLEAYEFFFGALLQWLTEDEQDGEERARSLLRALGQKIVMVVIDIDDEDDAQMIFETLNARGTPLLPSDLVKNYLFRRAEVEGLDVERLHENYWRPFDDDMSFWRGEVNHGRRKRPRIDIFLHHYLTLMRADEVSVEKLFGEFQELAAKSDRDAEWHLKELHDYAMIFRRFMENFGSDREGVFFWRMENMETTTVFPFLLGLYRDLDEENREDLIAILGDIESFLVRRMVCGLTTKNYNRFFLDLIGEVRKDGVITHNEVREFLLSGTGDSVRWPDDEEFREAWMNRQLFNRLKRTRLRMVLHALDWCLFDEKSEYYDAGFNLTIEHIMPQAWEVNWPLPKVEGETPEQHRERIDDRNWLIHTIGNLTMLTKQLNPAVSNGPFELKRKEINEFSILSLNRFLHHTETWDEEAIVERSAELFELAREEWGYPSGSLTD